MEIKKEETTKVKSQYYSPVEDHDIPEKDLTEFLRFYNELEVSLSWQNHRNLFFLFFLENFERLKLS